MNSILSDIKKLLGINPDYSFFDDNIILLINTVFADLFQLGLGDKEPYRITGYNETWEIINKIERYNNVITLIYLKVKILFDNVQNSFLLNSYEKVIEEETWRLIEMIEEVKRSG